MLKHIFLQVKYYFFKVVDIITLRHFVRELFKNHVCDEINDHGVWVIS